MPIVIRETNIKANVQEQAPDPSSENSSVAGGGQTTVLDDSAEDMKKKLWQIAKNRDER